MAGADLFSSSWGWASTMGNGGGEPDAQEPTPGAGPAPWRMVEVSLMLRSPLPSTMGNGGSEPDAQEPTPGAGPAPWGMVVVSLMLRSTGRVADTPFLDLTQGAMGGGRYLGGQNPEDSKDGRAASSPLACLWKLLTLP